MSVSSIGAFFVLAVFASNMKRRCVYHSATVPLVPGSPPAS